MSSSSDIRTRGVGRIRRRLLAGTGVALLVAGIAVLSIGLVSYFGQDEEGSDPGVIAPPLSLDEIEGLPVAVPYYNRQRAVAEPEPAPEAAPAPEPATAPQRMVIDSIGVDGPVIEMGLDANNYPQVPGNGADIAWYSDFSTKPGAGSNAVFAGHINWERAPGVFAELDKVKPGDNVQLISEDGREYTYKVFANFPVDPTDPESLQVMNPTPTDTITLITCGGTWVPDAGARFGGNYTTRTIVQGKLVDSTVLVPNASATSDG